MLAKAAGVNSGVAARTLDASGENLPVALLMLWKKIGRHEAAAILAEGKNSALVLRKAHSEWKHDPHRSKFMTHRRRS